MSAPAVSVVIPAYNSCATLRRAVDSVIRQTFTDWEIVVVDDGSTDETPRVITEYERQLANRFVSIRQENRGASSARNRGIDACSGRFVALLDADDEFLPNKLERQLELFARQPDLGFVFSDYSSIDLEERYLPSAFATRLPEPRNVCSSEIAPGLRVCHDLFDTLIRRYFIATIVGMFRRDAVGAILRFDEDLSYAEEWVFYLRLARSCAAGFVDEPLSLHHHVPGSVTRTDRSTNTRSQLKTLKRIAEAFPDMTSEQQRVLRKQIATAALQIAYDRHSAGDYTDASRHFAASLEAHASLPAVGGFVEDVCRSVLSRRSRPAKETVHGGL